LIFYSASTLNYAEDNAKEREQDTMSIDEPATFESSQYRAQNGDKPLRYFLQNEWVQLHPC
jgi:hypothetical protein